MLCRFHHIFESEAHERALGGNQKSADEGEMIVKSGVIGFMGLTRLEVRAMLPSSWVLRLAMPCSYGYALTFCRRCGKRWLSNEPG